jgi:ergothioneine biosynthesis protein EgtB
MVRIPESKITLGLERDGNQFGWDNEFEAHEVDVPAFEINKFKVTNGQFLEFVKAGGYEEASFWTKADWEWKTEAGVIHPVFWLSDRDVFRYRSMFAEIPLPLESPVYVSHAEASAYARWVGKTLPTEAEWQRAAEGATEPKETRVLWDPPFIGTAPETKSVYGAEGLVGTGWEWTSSHFAGFNGFQVDAVYPGYSANFFDNQHFVMKGGSPRTAACMLRPSFRNWFQPHYQYVYAGFRCATREASK